MDSTSFDEFIFDPSKCTKLSMEKKRELVYELSKWPYSAQEMLQTWSRQEILQILCAEMGKERKYTGLTKLKIIENLLKIISEKKLKECGSVNEVKSQASLENSQRASKRPRKTDNPIRLPSAANNVSLNKVDVDLSNVIFCKNSACRAKLSQEDAFCKRCSCCICHQYDDNKDPSLWLVCSSEPPYLGDSCGMSCHLECAFKHEKSGIVSDRLDKGLDGIFHCISCGKVNDLLGCWRKQLIIARDTRRVDILCYRVSLSQKLLFGIRRYQKLHEIVYEAVQKLEKDVGPLTGLPVKMARGIVNRLSSGAEVQRLCALAVDSLDSICNTNSNVSCNAMNQGTSLKGPNVITFEDVSTSSFAVIFNCEDSTLEKSFIRCSIWHRKSDMDYSAEPTCTLFPPNTRFLLSNLTPTTVYQFKVVLFDSDGEVGTYVVQHETSSPGFEAKITNPKTMAEDRSKSPATNSSSLSNPSSVEDEANNVMSYANEIKNREDPLLTYCENAAKLVSADLSSDTTERTGTVGDPVSMLDEERATQKSDSMHNSDAIEIENKHSPDGQNIEETSTDNGSATPILTGMECVPIVATFKAGLPTTPCKLENIKDGIGRNGKSKLCNKNRDNETVGEEEEQVGSSSKKRKGEGQDGECAGTGGKDFEYYVKVIRWLECDGHIEATFRQKFLTWYSLRATPQEVRIVKAFVDTLFEDPASLAGQLVDTFSDVITSNRSRVVPSGFFLKLWH